MAKNFTTAQRALLRAPNLKARLLTTWYLDEGTYRFCDNPDDITVDGNTWIGASALASVSDIKSGSNGASEPVKVVLDGTRLYQAGFEDPAELFRNILDLQLSNRAVDFDMVLGYHDSEEWGLKLPLFAGKINHPKIIEPSIGIDAKEPSQPRLEITIDSITIKYGWVSSRVRSHQDQLEIDPTDMFFSFTHNNLRNEQKLYWGKKAPLGGVSPVTGGGGTGGGGGGGGAPGGGGLYQGPETLIDWFRQRQL